MKDDAKLKPSTKTPAAAASAAAREVKPNPTFTLPVSGLVCEKTPFKGKHVREAQRLVEGDQTKAQFAIIACACIVDGKRITLEELDELDGIDVMTMIAEFESLFS